MSTEVKRSDLHSHSKNASLPTSKMQNIPSESKPLKESKKKASVSCAQNQDGKKVLKENKCKLSSTKSNMCFCSPTTHEGSFRCRLHRISAAKKSSTEKINLRCVRFGRVGSAEFGSHDSLIQLSKLGS
ncbi:uncharacterized protein LOC127121486 [Lathyrus oleraceus]|uniref:Uncharacterized protein n=1 Tax=Pisum sativum TaxID=3888 RepID=A0A9D5BCJ5_PEA|nr:uncharacterized protein LOC127121486 [Pisum sativum]KAI5438129.1 hypothetical protein KIW84_024030 [Pisum sativum]